MAHVVRDVLQVSLPDECLYAIDGSGTCETCDAFEVAPRDEVVGGEEFVEDGNHVICGSMDGVVLVLHALKLGLAPQPLHEALLGTERHAADADAAGTDLACAAGGGTLQGDLEVAYLVELHCASLAEVLDQFLLEGGKYCADLLGLELDALRYVAA